MQEFCANQVFSFFRALKCFEKSENNDFILKLNKNKYCMSINLELMLSERKKMVSCFSNYRRWRTQCIYANTKVCLRTHLLLGCFLCCHTVTVPGNKE